MTAFAIDIAIRANEDWVDAIALWLPDNTGAPTTEPFPIDNTWLIEQHLRMPNEMLIPAWTNSSVNGRLEIVTVPPNTGDSGETRIQWNVTREDIQYLPAGTYYHDIKLTDPDGGEWVFGAGMVTVTQGTTRP